MSGDWGTVLNAAFPLRFGRYREESQPSPGARRGLDSESLSLGHSRNYFEALLV
jgi:hypothetical protein